MITQNAGEALVVHIYDSDRGKMCALSFRSLGLSMPLANAVRDGFVAMYGPTSFSSQMQTMTRVRRFAQFLRVSKLANKTPLPKAIFKDFSDWLKSTSLSTSTIRATLNTCLLLLMYIERNEAHLLSEGTRLIAESFPKNATKHRRALSEDVVKKILRACHESIEKHENQLTAARRIRRGVFHTSDEATHAELVAELLAMGNGSMPTKRAIWKAGNALVKRVKLAGGIREISKNLWLSQEALLPFYLALVIQTSGNPQAILKIRRDCISEHPLRSDLERIVWEKKRAHSEQRADAPVGRPWSAANLVRRLCLMNEDLIGICRDSDKERLFIAYRTTDRKAGMPSTGTIHQWLRAFIKLHDLPEFTFSEIRRAGAIEHHRATGMLRSAQLRLNHASIGMTSHYTIEESQIRDHHDLTIRRFQGIFVQASLGIRDKLPVSSESLSQRLNGPAETVFGFRCIDPFAGMAAGSAVGSLCLQFQRCATCPGALIPLDDVVVVARLLSAYEALKEARNRAINEGWMPRYKAQYETTWRVLIDEILPAISDEIKGRAMKDLDERLVPRLE